MSKMKEYFMDEVERLYRNGMKPQAIADYYLVDLEDILFILGIEEG